MQCKICSCVRWAGSGLCYYLQWHRTGIGSRMRDRLKKKFLWVEKARFGPFKTHACVNWCKKPPLPEVMRRRFRTWRSMKRSWRKVVLRFRPPPVRRLWLPVSLKSFKNLPMVWWVRLRRLPISLLLTPSSDHATIFPFSNSVSCLRGMKNIISTPTCLIKVLRSPGIPLNTRSTICIDMFEKTDIYENWLTGVMLMQRICKKTPCIVRGSFQSSKRAQNKISVPQWAPRNSYRAHTRFDLASNAKWKIPKIWRFSFDFWCWYIIPKLAENERELCRNEKSLLIKVYLPF